jgi:hypothetical protein
MCRRSDLHQFAPRKIATTDFSYGLQRRLARGVAVILHPRFIGRVSFRMRTSWVCLRLYTGAIFEGSERASVRPVSHNRGTQVRYMREKPVRSPW